MSRSRSEVASSFEDLASTLGHIPNEAEIELYTEFSTECIDAHFGSIKGVCEALDLPTERNLQPTEPIDGAVNLNRADIPSHTDLLQSIYLTGKTATEVPTSDEVRKTDLYNPEDYQAQFGTIENALDIALDAANGEFIGTPEIVEYLGWLSETLNRIPYPYDMYRSQEPAFKVELRVGSWKKGLEKAGIDLDTAYTVPTDELLVFLKDVSDSIKGIPTPEDVQRYSKYCASSYIRRFGSWEAALIEAGFEHSSLEISSHSLSPERIPSTRLNFDWNLDLQFRRRAGMDIADYLFDDLHRLAHELTYPPRPSDVANFGLFPLEVYINRYGTWPEVLTEAGLDWSKIASAHKESINEEGLESTIAILTAMLDREPTAHDLNCFTGFSDRTYISYFGSVDDALERSRVDRDQLSKWCRSATFTQDEVNHAKLKQRYLPKDTISVEGNPDSIINAQRDLYLENRDISTLEPDTIKDICIAEMDRVAHQLGRYPTKDDFNKLSGISAETVTTYYRSNWTLAARRGTSSKFRNSTEVSVEKAQEEAEKALYSFMQDSDPQTVDDILSGAENEFYTVSAKYDNFEEFLNKNEISLTQPLELSSSQICEDELEDLRNLYQYQYQNYTEEKRVLFKPSNLTEIEDRLSSFDSIDDAALSAGITRKQNRSYPPLKKEAILSTVKSTLPDDGTELKPEEYQNVSDISATAVEKRWGSVENAIDTAKSHQESHSKNNWYSDEELLDVLQDHGDYPKNPPRAIDIDSNASISSATVTRRFGNFRTALLEAGYDIPENWPYHRQDASSKYDKEEIYDEITRVAEMLEETPSRNQFKTYANISLYSVIEVCGSWSSAVESAGYKTRGAGKTYTDEEIINSIQEVAKTVGWVPTSGDFEEHSKISMSAVRNHFGTWSQAREVAGVSDMSEDQIRALQDDVEHAPKRKLIDDLERLHEQIGKSITTADIISFGEYAPEDYEAAFGSILEGMRAAGIKSE